MGSMIAHLRGLAGPAVMQSSELTRCPDFWFIYADSTMFIHNGQLSCYM